MPSFNRKGPEGKGPMTGRRMGYCNENVNNIESEPRTGRGFGRSGYRRRMHIGRGINRSSLLQDAYPNEENTVLLEYLDKLEKRIEKLEKGNTDN